MARSFSTVRFGDNSPIGARRLELLQRYESHTVAVVDVTVPSRLLRMPDAAFYPEMTPVVVRWGYLPTGVTTFHGYVNHCEALSGSDTNDTLVRYVCLGTSLPMNTAAPRSWSRVTASAVVAQIAARHRLRAVLHRSDVIMPTFTLTTETDFQALQRLAAETGYRVWVDGGSVFFLDPQVLVSGPGMQVAGTFGTVADFHITTGSMAPRDGGVIGDTVVQGRDPATQAAFRVRSGTTLKAGPADLQGTRPFLTTVLPGEASTYAEARRRARVASRSQNWITATLTVPGAPAVRPGRLVRITSGRVPADHLGIWATEATRHVVESGDFSTEVEVARNQGRRPDFPLESPLVGVPEEVGCTRRGGAFWESEMLGAVHLS